MDLVILIPIIAAVLNLVMAAYIAGLGWQSPVNRAFIYLSLMLVAWGVTDALLWTLSDPETLYTVARIQTLVYTQSGIMILNVLYQYMSRERDLLFYYTLVICATLALAGISTPWMVEDIRMVPWGATPVAGPLYYMGAMFSVVIPVSTGLYLLIRHYRVISDVFDRARTRLFLSGIILALSISWTFDLIIPGVFLHEIPQQTHIAGLILQAFLFYGILKYRLLSIDLPYIARKLFSNARDGVLLIKGRRIKNMNHMARELIEPYIIDDKTASVLRFLDQCRESGEDQIEIIETDMHEVHALSVRIIDIQKSGTRDVVMMFVRDISDRVRHEIKIKQMNEELIQARDNAIEASLAKSQFLASMSHELRTPLNAVIGFSSLLMERLKDEADAELMDEIKEIYAAGNHLLELINGLLDISKIEARKYDLYIETIDLENLIQTAVNTSKPIADHNGNQIHILCGRDVDEMESDQTKLRQIIFNLIANACKFTKNGTITVACRRIVKDEPYYEIRVSDTGIGMTDEQLSRIFTAYQQADATISRKYGGTGLGLMLSKRICDMLGGEITVKSKIGAGSTFTALLPVVFKESMNK